MTEPNRLTIRTILEHPHPFDWTVKGLGMMRLNLTTKHRIQVWHDRLKTPGVTMIHTHPWDFSSTIIAGMVKNLIYGRKAGKKDYHEQEVNCAPGGGLQGLPNPVHLALTRSDVYLQGASYAMEAAWIHQTIATNGTVTFLEKERPKDQSQMAKVFWMPERENWVDAPERSATTDEVKFACRAALESWMLPLK